MAPAIAKSRAKRGCNSTSPAPPQAQNLDADDIVSGRLTRADWDSMMAQEDEEEVIAGILDEFMCRVMERCYSVYLQKQLIPFTVSKACDALVKTLEWQFLMQDREEGPDSAPLWLEDIEPQAPVTDSWAQGSVPVHSRSTHLTSNPQSTAEPSVGKEAPQPEPRAPSESSTYPEQQAPGKGLKDRTESQGLVVIKSKVLAPTPPKERCGQRRLQMLCHQPMLPALRVGRSPSPFKVSLEEQAQITSIMAATPPPQQHHIPAAQKLTTIHLPRRRLCPGFEVVKSNGTQSGSFRKGSLPTRNLKPKLQTLTHCEGSSKIQQRVPSACLFSRRTHAQEGGQTHGFTPLSTSLVLKNMKLSPGVSLRDLQGAHATSIKKCLSQPDPRLDLKPIQSVLPGPLLSLDQLILGPPPQISSQYSPSTTAPGPM